MYTKSLQALQKSQGLQGYNDRIFRLRQVKAVAFQSGISQVTISVGSRIFLTSPLSPVM